jgi:hypothetical protein
MHNLGGTGVSLQVCNLTVREILKEDEKDRKLKMP